MTPEQKEAVTDWAIFFFNAYADSDPEVLADLNAHLAKDNLPPVSVEDLDALFDERVPE